jgi:hypothetical protein
VNTEKPQKGNPHKLPIWQHVLSARSIKRFTGPDGNVAVKRCQSKHEFRVPPDDRLFCVQRSWDRRSETGYMKQIEDEFQILADAVMGGLRTIDVEKSRIITRFFALWCSRFRQRYSPTPDHAIYGVAGECLSKDQEEMLERNHIGFFRAHQTMPGRFVSGLQIQIAIDQLETHFRGCHWGVVGASEGEFLVPDTFGVRVAVPLSPTICLFSGCENMELSMREIAKLNRLAVQSAKDYHFARDFNLCPV